jgi:hypothetical protein
MTIWTQQPAVVTETSPPKSTQAPKSTLSRIALQTIAKVEVTILGLGGTGQNRNPSPQPVTAPKLPFHPDPRTNVYQAGEFGELLQISLDAL